MPVLSLLLLLLMPLLCCFSQYVEYPPGTVPASAMPSMNLTARKLLVELTAAMLAAMIPQLTAMAPSMVGPPRKMKHTLLGICKVGETVLVRRSSSLL